MDKEKLHLLDLALAMFIGLITFLLFMFWNDEASPDTGTASWYSRESCRREGTSGIMANGKELDDEAFTCASWDYPFGTILMVDNVRTNKSVLVEVTDRGPAKRLYRMGRIIDLSKRAFSEIDDLGRGIVKVSVEAIKNE